jgi:Calcineurin-like phosphoesterase
LKISEINIVTFCIIGIFFSLFLLTNNFNLLKINLFNDDVHNFFIDTLQVEKADALEINVNTNNSQIINHNDTKENEKNLTSNSSKEVGLKKESNKKIQDQKGGEDDNILDLKNTNLQNTGLSTTTTTKSANSSIGGFNFAAAGDWACSSKAKDTVKNIIDHDPELVLALGDLSYDSSAKCWLKIIKPIAEKTKITLGNHEADSSKKLKDYMKAFDLEKQYYSFNYQNVHFLALSTETSYDEGSKQYKFAEKDLKQYSNDKSIDWIVVFYHKQAYSSGGGLPDEKDFRENYHPLFDRYNVDLALQGHHHAYERFYPIIFNDKNDNKPIVSAQDKVKGSNVFQNPEGTIFLTVGTGGAESMMVSKSKPFSAAREDGKFGILNISIEKNEEKKNILTGAFIDNKKKHKILDEFKIIKESK